MKNILAGNYRITSFTGEEVIEWCNYFVEGNDVTKARLARHLLSKSINPTHLYYLRPRGTSYSSSAAYRYALLER